MLWLAICVVYGAASDAGATAQPDAGGAVSAQALLLGVSSDRGLETFLIDGASIESLGSGLAVPTPRGWLRLSLAKRERSGGKGDRAWSESLTRVVVAPGRSADPAEVDVFAQDFDPEPGYTEENVEAVSYAGPELLSIHSNGYSNCGGAHPNTGSSFTTTSLGATGAGDPIAPAGVLGPQVSAVLERLQSGDDCERQFDANKWGIRRHEAAWQAMTVATTSIHACGSRDVVLELALPARITGPGKLDAPWEKVRAANPAALDAIGSPDGRFLVLVTGDGLQLIAAGAALGQTRIKAASVVMTEWVYGAKNIGRWRREAGDALHPPERPKRKR